MPALAYLVGGKGVHAAVTVGDPFLHRPIYRPGIGHISVQIGEAGSLGGLRLSEGLPDVGHRLGTGAGGIRIKGNVNHFLFIGPVGGGGIVTRELGEGRGRAGRLALCPPQEGQNLNLGAVHVGGKGGLAAVAVGDALLSGPDRLTGTPDGNIGE